MNIVLREKNKVDVHPYCREIVSRLFFLHEYIIVITMKCQHDHCMKTEYIKEDVDRVGKAAKKLMSYRTIPILHISYFHFFLSVGVGQGKQVYFLGAGTQLNRTI